MERNKRKAGGYFQIAKRSLCELQNCTMLVFFESIYRVQTHWRKRKEDFFSSLLLHQMFPGSKPIDRQHVEFAMTTAWSHWKANYVKGIFEPLRICTSSANKNNKNKKLHMVELVEKSRSELPPAAVFWASLLWQRCSHTHYSLRTDCVYLVAAAGRQWLNQSITLCV